jgi:hypothetical protein
VTVDHSGGVPARRPDPPDEGDVPGYKRAWRWWLVKSTVIARKQNTVFSWLAYYLGMSWVGWWFRFTKQDRLDRATLPVGESGWKDREGPIQTDPDRVRRPF